MARSKPITHLNIQAPTAQNARIVIKMRLDEMYQWDSYVDEPYQVTELHNLRIAAKRLRYSLEVFSSFLPEGYTVYLKEVELIQEELGSLHDSDVMIALLRLCLGSLDSGSGYQDVLAHAAQGRGRGVFIVNSALISKLLDPAVAPSASQRYGLELLLQQLQQQRAEQYTIFRKHWYRVKGQDMRHAIIDLLNR